VVALALLGTISTIFFAWHLSAFVTRLPGASLPAALIFAGVKGLTLFGQEVLASKGASQVKQELRVEMIRRISSADPTWRRKQNNAELNLLLTSGLDSLDTYFAKYLPQLIYTVLAMPIFLSVIWIQDQISGITLAITMPLIPLFMIFIGIATSKLQSQQLDALTGLSRQFGEAVRGLVTLRVFSRADRQIAVLNTQSAKHRSGTMKVLSLSFVSGFALELIASLSVALIAVSIGLRLLDGSISFATGLFVLLLAPDAYLPLRMVGANFHAAADGVTALGKVFDLFESWTPRVRKPSFHPEKGKISVLTGPSGSGKSTALETLISESSSWMPQGNSLLDGTIRENIVGPSAKSIDSLAMARAIKISELDDVYVESKLSSLQSSLSGGQIQRVMLARALYRLLSKGCVTLLLDEPTSAQDSKRLKKITRNLKQLSRQGFAVVVVTHQREFISLADEEFEVNDA
jgi:ATP-binding cassette subfamily C protein CydD